MNGEVTDFDCRFLPLFSVMGSVTSALTRTRNALVKVGSEPETHDLERSQSAPKPDRSRKKSARFVSIQTGRQSSRQSLSDVLSRQDSDRGKQTLKKKTSEGPQSGELKSYYMWSQDYFV